MKILIVEDETVVAELLRRSLESLGNRCLVAADTTSADRMLHRHEVDAVTLDLSMPGKPGLAWLEGIAATRPGLARHTLVITGGQLESKTVERVTRCGAGVLAKPFTQDGLSAAVRAQIDRPAAARPD